MRPTKWCSSEVGSYTSTKRKRRGVVKFLVIAEYCVEDFEKFPAKTVAFTKAMEEYADRFPEFPVGLHMFAHTSKPKGIAIWETDSPEKLAYKLSFMLPEVTLRNRLRGLETILNN